MARAILTSKQLVKNFETDISECCCEYFIPLGKWCLQMVFEFLNGKCGLCLKTPFLAQKMNFTFQPISPHADTFEIGSYSSFVPCRVIMKCTKFHDFSRKCTIVLFPHGLQEK